MNTSMTRFSGNIELGRILGQLLDHKWLLLAVTLLFACGGILYATLATPLYQGDALVQVERRSSVSPLGDLANVMGDPATGYADSSTAAEVQILQSRMVLGQVVERTKLEDVVIPRALPLIGGVVHRRQVTRPGFIDHDVRLADWLPEQLRLSALLPEDAVPAALKGGISLPEFLKTPFTPPGFGLARAAVWGGESLTLGRFDATDRLRNQTLILTALGEGRYTLTLVQEQGRQDLGEGVVGRTERFADGEIELRIASLQAAPGAQFTLIKRSRSAAIKSLAGRLSVTELGQGSRLGADTGMLRLTLSGPDRAEIRHSLNAVVETFLTQNVERKSAEADQSLAFLREQAPELRSQLAVAEDRLNEYRTEQDSVDLTAEAQGAIEQFISIDSRLSELQIEEAALAERYTTSHPTYQALLRQKRLLVEEREALDTRVNQLPAAQQEVIRRTRDVEVTQAIYVNVLNKMQELEVARAGTVGNVRIIDDALVDALPVEPRKPLIIVLATVLGALVAVGLVLTRAFFQRGVETPEQLEDVGLPVYASVPLSDEQKKLNKRVKHRSERQSRQVFSAVLAQKVPTDSSIEALRGLRTSLHFAMLDANDNRLMITGPSPGIGKSFVTVNLAAVCAQASQRVLIIDADMRKGHLHHAFAAQGHGGLSELLSGRLSREDAIRHTEVSGLDYIARGAAPPNPSELLMTSAFSHLLDAVSAAYDLVIIDTPPVLAVTDPAVVGVQCGTSLLVARFEANTAREMLNARRRLESAGVTVKGAILNAMERRAAVSYGYGYYQYAYR